MYRSLFLLAWFTSALLLARANAQTTASNASSKEITTAGLQLAPISNSLYEHVKSTKLKRGQGITVEKVLPNSPAARAGLKANDLLVSYDGNDIVDAAHFFKLIQATKPDRQVPLVLLRDGQESTLHISLLQGVATDVANKLKGEIKPGGPPEVIVETLPLDDGKLRVSFTYYPEGKSKLETLTCIGTLTEIEKEVRQVGAQRGMPKAVRDLVDVALKRLRKLDSR